MKMDNQEKKEDGKACCDKSKCCGKALAAFALLALGGTGGYFAGKCCGAKTAAPAAVEAPAK
jgi:hypothetical protein